MIVQNRKNIKENSYALAFEGSLYSGDLYWGYKLAFSVCPSLPLSVEVPGLWRGNGSRNLHQIYSVVIPTRQTCAFALFKGARHTWHVPPRKDLHKFVRASIGQTRDTADSKLAGHTCTTPTCVLLWLPFLRGAGCTRQGRKTFWHRVCSSGSHFVILREFVRTSR